MTAGTSHAASIVIGRPAETAFAFVADAENLCRWSFGTWETKHHADGLVEGRSLLDGAVTFVKISADAAARSIWFQLGAGAGALTPRIVAHIVPGAHVGIPGDHCVLTLLAWRAADMSDERWRRLTAAHEFEMILLKSLIERL